MAKQDVIDAATIVLQMVMVESDFQAGAAQDKAAKEAYEHMYKFAKDQIEQIKGGK